MRGAGTGNRIQNDMFNVDAGIIARGGILDSFVGAGAVSSEQADCVHSVCFHGFSARVDRSLIRKENKLMNRELSASITVEAAFAVPLIVFAMLLLILLCAYEYDRVLLQAGAILTCERTLEKANEINSVPSSAEIERLSEGAQPKGLILCRVGMSVQTHLTGSAELTGVITMDMPDVGVFTRAVQGIREYKTIKKISYTDREKTLRMIVAGEQIWDRVVK